MNNIRVLCVEDDEQVANAIELLLLNFFENIDLAANGHEGYKLFCKNRYDLIITDINMPILNGIDMIGKVRELNSNIPIIIISAHTESKYFIESIKLGVDGYILKPIEMSQFINTIEKVSSRIISEGANKTSLNLMNEYKDIIDEIAIVSKTDVNGNITYVNEAFVKLSGYSKDELIGSNHNIIRHPDSPKGLFEDMWNRILNKEVWKGRVKNKTKDGGYYWVNVVIKPIIDENNNIIEFIAVRTNITNEVEYKKNLELQVKEKVKKLREKDKFIHQQSKLASMGEMIDAIAHQWIQPINIIKINTEMLGYDFKDSSLDEAALKDFQKLTFSQIDHILNTLNEFRDFLRPNKMTQNFNVETVINSVLVLVNDELMKYSIKINIDNSNDVSINGIENEFKHVILNLINNSKDAFIQHDIKNRTIDITIKKDEKRNIITIQDNAGGIPFGIIDHIFEANVTTKAETTGTGIGLYMSKQIIEKMGAKIIVKNKNDGAYFKIII